MSAQLLGESGVRPLEPAAAWTHELTVHERELDPQLAVARVLVEHAAAVRERGDTQGRKRRSHLDHRGSIATDTTEGHEPIVMGRPGRAEPRRARRRRSDVAIRDAFSREGPSGGGDLEDND